MSIYRKNRQHKNHNITDEEWIACKEYFNNECAYCGLPLREHWIMYSGNKILGDFHKEHINDNGSNDLSNCIPSCKSCNSQKWETPFEQWYNKNNPRYTKEKFKKILKWKQKDYLQYKSE